MKKNCIIGNTEFYIVLIRERYKNDEIYLFY